MWSLEWKGRCAESMPLFPALLPISCVTSHFTFSDFGFLICKIVSWGDACLKRIWKKMSPVFLLIRLGSLILWFYEVLNIYVPFQPCDQSLNRFGIQNRGFIPSTRYTAADQAPGGAQRVRACVLSLRFAWVYTPEAVLFQITFSFLFS